MKLILITATALVLGFTASAQQATGSPATTTTTKPAMNATTTKPVEKIRPMKVATATTPPAQQTGNGFDQPQQQTPKATQVGEVKTNTTATPARSTATPKASKAVSTKPAGKTSQKRD